MYNIPDYMDYVERRLKELAKMSDEELRSYLSDVSEEETMRALGYTKKEGK